MAEATMTQMVEAVHALLQAELAGCVVEQGNKDEAPTVTTAYVRRKGDSPDTGLYLTGDVTEGIFKRVSIEVMIESPMVGEAAEEELDDLREAVRGIVQANRDLSIAGADDPADGRDEGCECVYVYRPGRTTPNSGRRITASWRV
jgi:hypothetical protein